jgi:hypothetical protein
VRRESAPQVEAAGVVHAEHLVCVAAVFLREQAVFTAVIRAPADKAAEAGIHHKCWFDSKLRRALSLKMTMKSEA